MPYDRGVLISVITPTYNRGNMIGKTIASILAQDNQDFELIIVDDGSTDDTKEVVKKYLGDKVKYYKKDNGERAAARNYGTAKAVGKYVTWFDSDDIMLPFHLTEAARMIKKYAAPEVFALAFRMEDSNGKILLSMRYPTRTINERLKAGNDLACNPVFVKKEIALAYPFNEDRELSATEDYELWIRLAARFPIYCADRITSIVIVHDNRSVITMTNPQKLINRFEKFLQYTLVDAAIRSFFGKEINTFKMRNYLALAVELAKKKHKKEALKYIWKGCLYNISFLKEKAFYASIRIVLFNR